MASPLARLPEDTYFLYDPRGRILWLSAAHSPYRTQEIVGQFAWHALDGHDVTDCQAALTRCVATGEPQCIESVVRSVGRWRTWFFLLHNSGRARILGIAKKAPVGIERLSAREREVLTLVAAGLTTKALSHRLGIARATADIHRRNAAATLGISPSEVDLWCGIHREWLS